MKTVKTLIASVVLAVAAFSANVNAMSFTDNDGSKLVTSDSWTNAVLITSAGRFHFSETGYLSDQIDNYGNTYQLISYIDDNSGNFELTIKHFANSPEYIVSFFKNGRVIGSQHYYAN